eukprot:TRINITY_DN2701_c0_g1_i1.p1 TRINITY_DN2701_c0_g1~~TRINITY_DN2701_c0_g1_i1.p1  ORF type:complete len:636 (-),score=121.80 TRINITY_DN2701_c0_g1_i1:945-2852(-)
MTYTLTDALGAPPGQFLQFWLVPWKFGAMAFKRRMVDDQIAHNLKVSGGVAMKKELGWLSFAGMGVGAIIATGIFSFMPSIYATITGPAVVLSLLLASVTAAMTALIYSEFAVEYPVVGGGFVYVLNTFGELPAILCAVNLVMDYVFGTAAVVRNFSVYFSELLNKDSDIFQVSVGFQTDQVDYMALGIIIFLSLVAIISTKVFDEGNLLLQLLHVGLVVFTFVAAFSKAEASNWSPFFPPACGADFSCPADGSLPTQGCVDASYGPAGGRRVVTGASNIFFVFIGYDVIALSAEEARSSTSVPVGMMASVIFVTIIYITMAASLIMLYPFAGLACQNANVKIAGFAYAFTQRGMDWAKYVVAAGACVGIFASSGITVFGLSRVFQVFAREGVMPAFVGHLNPYTYTPAVAIAAAGLCCGLMAFFTAFETLANMTSIGTLAMYWFVSLALIYRRYAPEFETPEIAGDRHLAIRFRPNPFGRLSVAIRRFIILAYCAAITACALGFTIYWNLSTGSVLLIVCAILWFVFTLALQLTCPIHYVPAKFSIPSWAMPWCPSIAIFSVIMLVGGFGANESDYWRLFGAMGIGIIIYCLYGVHASYYRFYGAGAREEEEYKRELEMRQDKIVEEDHEEEMN